MKVGKTSKTCSICFSKFQQGEIINQLPCTHIFHKKCIKPWLKQSSQCPNCRFDIKKYEQEQKKKQKKQDILKCQGQLISQSPQSGVQLQSNSEPQIQSIIQLNRSNDSL